MTASLFEDFLRLHDESTLREKIRTSLTAWAEFAMAFRGFQPAGHHRLLLSYLEQVSAGAVTRLLVLMPPGSAKSTYASIVFPAWWFTQHPRSSIIAASSTAALVTDFGGKIAELISTHHERLGYNVASPRLGKSGWRTGDGGDYFAIGTRGAVIGRRADLVLLDDPIRSISDVERGNRRTRLWEWYAAELVSRLRPAGRIVLTMTRWHRDDLCGQILEREADRWTILKLPAIAEADDPLGRPPGVALWPEWEPEEILAAKRSLVGPKLWAAMFQQSPADLSDGFFEVGKIRPVDGKTTAATDRQISVRAWDLAGTEQFGTNNPDWTVGLKVSRDNNQRYVIEDILRFRAEPQSVQATILATARQDGYSVMVSLPIDPGQAGKAQAGGMTRSLMGYRVHTSREIGSKISRALLPAAQIAAGNMAMVMADWNRNFIFELGQFPDGDKDDQVDALSRAIWALSECPASGRRLDIPLYAR